MEIGTPPTTPSDPKSRLEYHDVFGQFGIDLVGAQSPKYEQWASLANANSTQLSRRSSNSSYIAHSTRSFRGKRSVAFTNSTGPTGSNQAVKPKGLYRFRGVSGLRFK